MTHEVNQESSETTCSAPRLKHSQEPGYIYDTVRKRWIADTRDGLRICNRCKIRRPVEWFTGNKQKSHTCRECRRYIKASQRYHITYEQAKQLYAETQCHCCGVEFNMDYPHCIHHIDINGEIIIRGIVCKPCNWLLRDESNEHKRRIACIVHFMGEDIVRSI